jgi:hypothetical protein
MGNVYLIVRIVLQKNVLLLQRQKQQDVIQFIVTENKKEKYSMNKEDIEKLIQIGSGRISLKEIELDDIPRYQQTPIMVPVIFQNKTSSVSEHIWNAFENVINKTSSKKYINEKSMKKAMNTMLYNELSKRNIIIKGA